MTTQSHMTKTHPVLAGLKLGMLLQFGGMGPISLLVFQLGAILPFSSVLSGIAGVTLADTVYILVSLLGIVGIIKQIKNTSSWFRRINGMIIAYFGLSFILMSFGERVSYLDFYDWNAHSVFTGVFLLTILNPVTIICYTGVFNAKVIDMKMSSKDLYLFGLGTLVTTPIFMLIVAASGALGGHFFYDWLLNVMNLVVGFLLIFWGLRYIFPKFDALISTFLQKLVKKFHSSETK